MSHGGGGAVPNLIPLLDIVFQLLMFFMMCVNFVSEQVNASVKLPLAQAARPMDSAEASAVMMLNMSSSGELLMANGLEPLTTSSDIRFFLKQQFADDERLQKGNGEKRSVIIRADKGADYEKVYDVLSICKEVGYRKLQLRAQQMAKTN